MSSKKSDPGNTVEMEDKNDDGISDCGDKVVKKHALLEDFLLQYPCWEEAADRAFLVYQDLVEVQNWWSTHLSFCESLDRPYVTGRPSRHTKLQAVLPLLSEEQLTMEDVHAFFTHLKVNLQPVVAITLAVLEVDSTLVYYKITDGISPPEAPEIITHKKKEKHDKMNRKRRHIATCVRDAIERMNKEGSCQ